MKKAIFISSLAITVAAPFFAFAQDNITISPNIPGTNNIATTGPCGWIVNFYQFALFFSGILAFGAIVFGGFLYATSAGNPSRQSEGRSWIQSALLGLLLLAGAYVILYTINPNLTQCSLPSLEAIQTSAGGQGGNTGPGSGGGKCQPPTSGPCGPTEIQNNCFANPQIAAGICGAESSGNANAKGDKCDDGNFASIGLFQINLSANTIQDPTTGKSLNCPSAFSNAFTGSNPHCTITNQSLYQQCLTAALNPATNIQKACQLSQNGTTWNLWGPATKQACGL